MKFWNVHLLIKEFERPEVMLWGWQDAETQLLTFARTEKASSFNAYAGLFCMEHEEVCPNS